MSRDVRLEQLLTLARTFRLQGDASAAAQLLHLALKVSPQAAEARQELALLRQEQRQKPAAKAGTSLEKSVREDLRRSALDGAQFVGLARLYEDTGQDSLAFECLEIAKVKSPANPQAYRLSGELLLQHGDAEAAAHDLRRAHTFDPFDRDSAELLGLAEHQLRRFEQAARATAHAFLLVGRLESVEGERLRRRLQTLKRILHWGKAEMSRLFAAAKDDLDAARERLEWHRERFLGPEPLPQGGAWIGSRPAAQTGSRLSLAGRLRHLPVLADLSDELIFKLAEAAHEEYHEPSSLLFGYRDDSRDLYLIEDGRVRLERTGDYGTFPFREMGPGEMVGEAATLLAQPRIGDAVASKPCRVLRLDAEALDRLTAGDPALAHRLLWCQWHSLAAKLRSANEKLRAIFAGPAPPPEVLAARWRPTAAAEPVHLEREDKVRVFREQGLTAHDMATLATFSREQRYRDGAYLFREGDKGEALYAIVDGRVLISKFIPGGGDEALAVFSRGEFFGEMALIDGQPRSADARAEGGPVTVLAVDRGTLAEMLSLDPQASLDFLRLLVRLVARRLREVDEKALAWQIISARQGGAEPMPMGVGQASGKRLA